MGWIIGIFIVLLVSAVVAFCVWYMRKDINSALSLMAAFWTKRIKKKVKKVIGTADLVEEKAKKEALEALDNLRDEITDEIDRLIAWVSNLNVIK